MKGCQRWEGDRNDVIADLDGPNGSNTTHLQKDLFHYILFQLTGQTPATLNINSSREQHLGESPEKNIYKITQQFSKVISEKDSMAESILNIDLDFKRIYDRLVSKL